MTSVREFLQSMTGRIFLILFAGIVTAALMSSAVTINEDSREFVGARTDFAAQRLQQLVLALEAVQPHERQALAEAAQAAGLTVIFYPAFELGGEPDRMLANALHARLGADRNIQAASLRSPEIDTAEMPMRGRTPSAKDVRLTLRDDTPVAIAFVLAQRPRWLRFQRQMMPLVVFIACIAALAFVVARFATRPLRRLAEAANVLGGDIDGAPIKVTGPAEVRQTALAFNAMQARIRHYVQNRTQMLAAITHDLQTPVTRLRLRIEQVADTTLREKLATDLAGIQAMSQEGLDLARSMESPEPMPTIDLDSLLDSICADAQELGQKVTLQGALQMPVRGWRLALRRCVTNLVENAVRYGDVADINVSQVRDKVVIAICDRGPGIPEQFLELVFEPFYRVEGSRSRETGGTGIGLTIARAITEKHGGTLTLRNHPNGGLEAILELPLKT